jgi:hypothetical protein
MSNIYRWSSKVASYQVSIHLAKRLQRIRFFRNQPIRNKNCLWRPCLLTDRDERSNLYRARITSTGCEKVKKTWKIKFHIFSSPCQRQCELLPSLGVWRPSSVNLVGSIYRRSSLKIAHFISNSSSFLNMLPEKFCLPIPSLLIQLLLRWWHHTYHHHQVSSVVCLDYLSGIWVEFHIN